jgi:hypothetical protein
MIKQNFIRMMGVLVLMLLILFTGHAFGNSWERLPEKTANDIDIGAKDIGIGANGSVWIIGTNPVSGGYGIYRWDGENWEGVDHGAVRIDVDPIRIDVDPQGNPWIVNDNGSIYKRVGNSLEQLFGIGTAKDIGIGANGSVWIIGTNTVSGGYGIYRWDWDGENWEGIDHGAVRIDVDPQGNPWIVKDNGNIYKRVGNKWEQLFGTAKDIGIGANGSVWIIGTNPVSGGYGIYRWDRENWKGIDGGAEQISVDRNGIPWVVNSSNHIYRKKRSFSDPWQWLK